MLNWGIDMETTVFVEFKEKLKKNMKKVIVGKDEQIDRVITAFICSGHVLLEDVPGLGKTKLARALSKSLGCDFKRVQFTPDILPSDLTGLYFYNQKSQEFVLKKGPIMTNILLADEINRATPRTQSALLECLEERQVTIEGETLKLDKPFFVIATQNPIEQFGTFPLPEAQVDRFFMKLSMGYPSAEAELEIINKYINKDPLEKLECVVTLDEIEYVQSNFSNVEVNESIRKYILEIINTTRNSENISLGVSPRGTLALISGVQAFAAISGRDYVIPEDIKAMAPSILAHRISIRNTRNNNDTLAKQNAIKDILDKVSVPLEIQE